jgi:hypothetical protein
MHHAIFYIMTGQENSVAHGKASYRLNSEYVMQYGPHTPLERRESLIQAKKVSHEEPAELRDALCDCGMLTLLRMAPLGDKSSLVLFLPWVCNVFLGFIFSLYPRQNHEKNTMIHIRELVSPSVLLECRRWTVKHPRHSNVNAFVRRHLMARQVPLGARTIP